MSRLVKKIIYSISLETKTGLHIGGTNASLNIGGPDKFVVRNPLTNVPYIPGSSLKGKMRSLTEMARGEIGPNNGPTDNPEHLSAQLFGVSSDTRGGHPSRLIVRDAVLVTPESKFKNTDLPYTESKTEVSINRVTAKANPRTIERVPAGAEFEVEMVLNVFDTDSENVLVSTLESAFKLLEDDYLGGNGSRGYGQVKIGIKKKDTKVY